MSHSLRPAHRYDELIVLDAAHSESYLGIGGEQSPSSNVCQASGKFDNRYCWVCRFAGGEIAQVRAYLDSALVARLFQENPIPNQRITQ